MRSVRIAVFLVPFLCGVSFAASGPGEGSWEVEAAKVYHGDADSFKSPATVDRDKVFAEISAYKQIEKEGLKDSHPRYWILLKKANDVFKKVLQQVADDEGHDLIAENGTVKPKGKGKKQAPEVTDAAIDKISDVESEESLPLRGAAPLGPSA